MVCVAGYEGAVMDLRERRRRSGVGCEGWSGMLVFRWGLGTERRRGSEVCVRWLMRFTCALGSWNFEVVVRRELGMGRRIWP